MGDYTLLQMATEINWKDVILAILLFIIGTTIIIPKIMQFLGYVSKPIKWFHRNDDDHEVLIGVVEKITELQAKQSEDVLQSMKHDQMIREDLSSFMEEMRNMMSDVSESQKDMQEKVDAMVVRNRLRDDAMIEEMCDRIEQKTRRYINELNGIPEDEYDSFVRLYKSYEAMGGNHGAHEKYEYCMKNLKVIPVITKMKND